MLISLSEFQKLEETRLALTKHILVEYSAIHHCHMQEQAVAYGRLRERAHQCDHPMELQDFIVKYGSGTNIPQSPAYIHTNNETIEESLKRLSMRSTQSPRKLYSSEAEASSLAGGMVWKDSHFASSGDAQHAPSIHGRFIAPSHSSRSSIARSIRSSIVPSVAAIAGPQASVVFNSRSSIAPSSASHRSFSPLKQASGRGSVSSTTSNSSFSSNWSNTCLYKVRALYTYEAQSDDEITIEEDQVIRVHSTNQDPWWFGQVDVPGAPLGLFPSNHVERI